MKIKLKLPNDYQDYLVEVDALPKVNDMFEFNGYRYRVCKTVFNVKQGKDGYFSEYNVEVMDWPVLL